MGRRHDTTAVVTTVKSPATDQVCEDQARITNARLWSQENSWPRRRCYGCHRAGTGATPDPPHPSVLSSVQTAYAMTIHRSQGSQYRAVSVALPEADSPLLSRQLLYTAITRARDQVRIIATQDAVAAAVTGRCGARRGCGWRCGQRARDGWSRYSARRRRGRNTASPH